MKLGPAFLWALWWQGLVAFRPENLAWRPEMRSAKSGGRHQDIGTSVTGLQHVPDGPVQFIANHGPAGQTLAILAAIIRALAPEKPLIVRRLRVVTGPAWKPQAAKRPGRLVQLSGIFQRLIWYSGRGLSRRIIHLGGKLPGSSGNIAGLRRWWRSLGFASVLVFPEGRGSACYDGCRPGVGPWLESLTRHGRQCRIPTIPVAVWCESGAWQVRFAAAIDWTPRQDLMDLQLDLALADLLPPPLAPGFQELLTRWRQVDRPNPRHDPSVQLS